MFRKSACLAAVLAAGCLCAVSHAQELPPGFEFEWLVPRHDIDGAICAAVAPDGRIFMALLRGPLRVWTPDRGLLLVPFHTFEAEHPYGLSLMGLALDPDFATNGFVYALVSYSSHAEIVRLTCDTTNPDVADPASITLIRSLSAAPNSTGLGGVMQFGPDGKLYIGTRDYGSVGHAQSLGSIHGKVLRLNSDGTIPEDNLFYDDTVGDCRAIWCLGLQYPRAIAFQPGTGRLFINDKAVYGWHEINEATPGDNFGSPVIGGDFDPVEFPDFTRPIFAYSTYDGFGRFIAGGVFYDPPTPSFPPTYTSNYFFADTSGGGAVMRLDTASGAVTLFIPKLPAMDLDVDARGRLLVLSSTSLLRVSYCRADFNFDAAVDSADIFGYLDEFFRSRPAADFNADGVVNSQDFFDYITAFIQGC